jgi:hypothetical protein
VKPLRFWPGIVAENRFSLYEYFITDKVGHAQDMELARRFLPVFRCLFVNYYCALIWNVPRLYSQAITAISKSYHHAITRCTAVPTIVWGAQRERVAARIQTLADITPAIVALLTNKMTNELSTN